MNFEYRRAVFADSDGLRSEAATEDRSSVELDGVVTRVKFKRFRRRKPFDYVQTDLDLRLGDFVHVADEVWRRRVLGFSSYGVFVSGLQIAQPWYSVRFTSGR